MFDEVDGEERTLRLPHEIFTIPAPVSAPDANNVSIKHTATDISGINKSFFLLFFI